MSINKIEELKDTSTDPMFLGGNVSITDAIHFFTKAGESNPVWTAIGQHLNLIASVGIRNQGTLAGNLMMKNAHNDFPSDVFLSMETAGATLEIVDPNGGVEEETVGEINNALEDLIGSGLGSGEVLTNREEEFENQ